MTAKKITPKEEILEVLGVVRDFFFYCLDFNKKESDEPPKKDPLEGKLFKSIEDDKLYEYLFSATCRDNVKNELIVIYKDIEDQKKYCSQWNYFFSSTKKDGKDVARFQEQV